MMRAAPGRRRWRGLRRWSEDRALGRQLVADCEAFLVGRYADELDARRLTVPTWAWTNLLAHGSATDLRLRAGTAPQGTPASTAWRAARAYLATEILDSVDRGASLAELQRAVLRPLELQLAARRDVRAWRPQRWVRTVRAAVAAYQHTRRG
jgi:hypothetical protein